MIGALQFRYVPASRADGFDKPVLFCSLNLGIQKLPDARESLEVPLDEIPRLIARDVQLAAQSEGTLPIDGCEVDRFGSISHFGSDVAGCDFENDRRCLTMYVATAPKRLDEERIVRQVRQQAQLDLGVVSHHE